jgi:copper(I)-binding protein
VSRSNKFRLAGAIAILIPVLAGCEAGLNAPTLQYHPAALGAYPDPSPTGNVDVTLNNLFVLGPALNQQLQAGSNAGLFLTMVATGSGDELTGAKTSAAASVKIEGGQINLAPNSPVNLTGPAPRIVLTDLTAPLSGGTTISLTLTFANAGQITYTVPVQPQAFAYATYDQPPVPAPTPTDTATATASPGATASAGTTAVHKHHAHGSASATPTPTPSPSA